MAYAYVCESRARSNQGNLPNRGHSKQMVLGWPKKWPGSRLPSSACRGQAGEFPNLLRTPQKRTPNELRVPASPHSASQLIVFLLAYRLRLPVAASMPLPPSPPRCPPRLTACGSLARCCLPGPRSRCRGCPPFNVHPVVIYPPPLRVKSSPSRGPLLSRRSMPLLELAVTQRESHIRGVGEWCPPRRCMVLVRPWRNWPFHRVTLYAVHCSANAARGVKNDVIILAGCQSFRIVLDFRHGDVGTPWPRYSLSSRALQLERKMAISVLLTTSLKRLLEERL